MLILAAMLGVSEAEDDEGSVSFVDWKISYYCNFLRLYDSRPTTSLLDLRRLRDEPLWKRGIKDCFVSGQVGGAPAWAEFDLLLSILFAGGMGDGSVFGRAALGGMDGAQGR